MSTFHTVIIECLLALAETAILHRLFAAFLTKGDQPRARWYGAGMVAYFLFQLYTYWAGCPLFSTAFFYLLFTLALAALFFEESFQIKTLVAFLFVVLNYACKVLAVGLLALLAHRGLPALPAQLVLNANAQILACALFLLFVAVSIGFRKLRIENKTLPYNIIVCLVPSGILLVCTRIFLHTATPRALSLYFDVALLLMFTALAMFYLLDKTVVIGEASRRNALIEQMLAMQQRAYGNLEESQRTIRGIRHDMQNHMQYILQLLQQGNAPAAQQYIEKIYSQVLTTRAICHSGNPTVDVMLNWKLEPAKAAGVHLHTELMLPPALPFDNVDLCVVLGNLLDNALEACQRTAPGAERFVRITARLKKDYLFLQVVNSYNGQVRYENGAYQTLKNDKTSCGIGLSNVAKVVKKYQGEFAIRHDEATFTVTAMLAMLPQSEAALN